MSMSIKDLAGANPRLQKLLSQLDQNRDGSLDRVDVESTPSFLATLRWPLQDRIDVDAVLVSSGLQDRLGYAQQLFQPMSLSTPFAYLQSPLLKQSSPYRPRIDLKGDAPYRKAELDQYVCVLRWNTRDTVYKSEELRIELFTDRCSGAPIESGIRIFFNSAPRPRK